MSTTSNQTLLADLQTAIGLLLDQAKEADLQRSSDTVSQFSIELCPPVASLDRILTDLTPYADLFDISLAYQIQSGSGTASLTPKGLLTADWTDDPDLSPPHLDTKLPNLFPDLSKRLSCIGEHVQVDGLIRDLDLLAQAGASVYMSLNVFLDKEALMQNLGWLPHVRGLLYVVADKFLQQVRGADFPALDALLAPNSEDTVVVMLGNTSGIAEGSNIRICGRDRWTSPDDLCFRVSEVDRKKLRDSISFRDEECHWEIDIPSLSPYHLHFESSSLNRTDILDSIARVRDRLSVAYLANRVQTHDGTLKCEFRGHKRVQIITSPLSNHVASVSIFKLFAWAYENSSSDKLGIVRQILSLQLGDDTDGNYSTLKEKSSEILEIAKSNFQLFLRRSVELYFDKRLKVSQFLQKFSEEVGASVSELTSELVSNLYKTVGVILGVVIAALVDPKQTPFIAFLTSLLYLIYIIFILIYLLPSTYWRLQRRVQDYQHSISGLRDVLSKEEISRLQGDSFQQARRMFLFYFGLTNVLYATLGAVACLVMRFFWGLL